MANSTVDFHKIDLSDLVTVTQMANRAGIKIPQMSNMATKNKNFPDPLKAPGIAGRVYYWPEVEEYLDSRKSSTTQKKVDELNSLRKRLEQLEREVSKA